jgi:serine protease Do
VSSFLVLWLLVEVLVGGVSGTQAQPSAPSHEPINPSLRSPFVAVAEHVMPAVVSITARKSFSHAEIDGGNPLDDMFRFMPRDREFMERRFDMPGAGSGFVVSTEGYVLTNNHVIEGSTEIEVLLPGREEAFPAEIVGQDPSTDLAVLRIDPGDETLPFLSFGDSDALEVGDWAIAIGNPLGQLAGSLTVGVISAKGRSDLNIQGGSPRYQDFLQTDAAINFGNSGGPLVDIHGQVIGVNTAINAAGQNIGFSVPVNLVARVYDQIRDHGRVIRGYLGVQMQTLTAELAAGKGIEVDRGVVVVQVMQNTPAEEAGILKDDVIVSFNGEDIREDRDLSFKVADTPVGSTATIRVYRDGDYEDIDVVLAEYPEEAVLASAGEGGDLSGPRGESWLGLTVKGLNDDDERVEALRETYEIREQSGVVVVDVETGSPADRARLRAGDVIVEIINSPIDTLDDFRNAARALSDRSQPIAMLVRRGEVTSYMTVDPLEGREE